MFLAWLFFKKPIIVKAITKNPIKNKNTKQKK